MALTVTTFREMFPAFTAELYPDSRVQFWLDFSVCMIVESRWGCAYENGQGLYTAHNLVLEREAGGASGTPNAGNSGLVSSKSVGPISKSVSQQDVTFAGAGNYNLTFYGRQFIQMARMFGAGGKQV